MDIPHFSFTDEPIFFTQSLIVRIVEYSMYILYLQMYRNLLKKKTLNNNNNIYKFEKPHICNFNLMY